MKWEAIFSKNNMKKYLMPFGYTIIVYGVIHLFFTLILVARSADITYWNVFYIVSASDLFPGIEKGLLSGIFSICSVVAVYCYFYFKKKK